MTEKLLDMLRSQYPLLEKDAGSFHKLKVKGMSFTIRCFEAQGLGHVSVMTASGFLGLMKMDTLILNPFEKDAPLFSYDRIHAMGNDKLYLELYNTMLAQTDCSCLDTVIRAHSHLPDFDPGSHWYDPIKLPQSIFKQGKKAHGAAFDTAVRDFLSEYLKLCQSAPDCDRTQKQEAASAYSRGLLEHGGPAADVFIGRFGRETTGQLFRTVLFGA